jgi:predicted nucleotide-binding protein (sugar kinase/HSP70/actin superfamily)
VIKLKIGIPRALLTYEYPILYTKFFEYLGIDIVLSDSTNLKIVEDGIKYSIDESCLASKIFMGHVANLIDKSKKDQIDYIFIPRVGFFDKKETVCVKFYALIDICKNVFDFKFLTLNVDYQDGESEIKAFLKLSKKLNKSKVDILRAYIKAKKCQIEYDRKLYNEQLKKITKHSLKNILIVSHPYIQYDNFLGKPIIDYLNKNNFNVCFANINASKVSNKFTDKFMYRKISKYLYWKYNKELLNGIVEYESKIDGIIYLSVFPCGTDALVNDMSIRIINNIPTLNIILDEQNSYTGIITRLESFIDILYEDSKVML